MRKDSADELQKDLARMRDGLEPLATGAAESAPTAVLAPRAPAGSDAETRMVSSSAAHGRAAGGEKRPILPRVAAALLASLVLLGGAAWAMSEGSPARGSAVADSAPADAGGELPATRDASREPSGERPEMPPREVGAGRRAGPPSMRPGRRGRAARRTSPVW